ncbi:nucleoside/nucleotide kinase family protein [Ideonella sp. 4Y16]|uniref:Nucleoside/nucleotide kinase family protein n=1 Tax=Ideonella alba TaxID=2824118 RepID=A0A941BKB7_9BURK|nr:nucleoside/nucleotide kinase family protein [Ideonella alba]MBQ0929974.1 nucleoside/nucleotide kinase family protein [Ideonella alba]MBQ0946012.1 nucleoside/nucleotide kinase family protein [Ideonella alba]
MLLRVDALLVQGGRRLLGLAAPPGAGKSTLAASVAAARPGQVQVLPMDGFHLAQAELQRLGRADRKGAPDTFDVGGFVALLQRLRTQRPGDATVWAPAFRREIEEPVAGAIAVEAATPLLLVEGNYLLHDADGWSAVAPLLDECGYLHVDDALRVPRLIARHVAHGRSPEAAGEWVGRSDEANAALVQASRPRAHWVLEGD